MSKPQKIWLWVSAVLFLLPEILWSPLVNFAYSFFMPTVHGSSQIWRDSFLLNSQFESFYIMVLLIQLLSIIAFTLEWIRLRNSLKSKSTYLIILILSILLSLATIFILFLVYGIS